MAHNLTKELQMMTFQRERNTTEKRSALWKFSSMGTIRQNIIHVAGRLINVGGDLTLSMNYNKNIKKDILTYTEAA